ncbi:MAG: hypothetical protein ACTSYU_11520, partial [Promethearchaeota archaeon]
MLENETKKKHDLEYIVASIVGIVIMVGGAAISVILMDYFGFGVVWFGVSVVLWFLIGASVVAFSALSGVIRRVVEEISENIANLNPQTHIAKYYAIMKVKNYYILSTSIRFYRIIFMVEKTPIEVSKFRAKYLGPKAP